MGGGVEVRGGGGVSRGLRHYPSLPTLPVQPNAKGGGLGALRVGVVEGLLSAEAWLACGCREVVVSLRRLEIEELIAETD